MILDPWLHLPTPTVAIKAQKVKARRPLVEDIYFVWPIWQAYVGLPTAAVAKKSLQQKPKTPQKSQKCGHSFQKNTFHDQSHRTASEHQQQKLHILGF